ncbi:TetR/AcrR family transcriptional regulator C-terminal domain-containing protein [Nocardioides bruguierae]|uniref:TetR/AcrR family transcriptional regulator C-terminal domain-containing protein n=1 Tax=Nocardioides bruguierae TaxID=2945102 RepID=A0A9X2D5J4_9ACTN|nr:TetR/AcrR family transcriptional regulator C-terminal domain-containing protein [Nocardioides bruguierae]MCM0619708.1 TetR/AcrR family transcriptional regulator C-terminal domain-containing protein [Nocardioides bruguierae]
MVHARSDVVSTALRVLDAHGLADLTMRRLAAELDVRPSALYHHVADKQTLLAAVADELLARGRRPATAHAWPDRVREVAVGLRDALLAWTDGAELVGTVVGFGLGGTAPLRDLEEALAGSGLPDDLVPVAARTVWHFTLGHTWEEQTHLQAGAAGAIPDEPLGTRDPGAAFTAGLELVLDGLRARADRSTDRSLTAG